MTTWWSLSRAMLLGFVRERTALFFTLLFPLMFLVIFGGLFRDQGQSPSEIVQVGPVTVLDQLPADARATLDDILTTSRVDDREEALRQVRAGDVAAAVEQDGGTVLVHYSAADQVRSGTVRGVIESLVQQGNLAAAGVREPALRIEARQVEDESLQAIQYITPGLLGWAVAFGALFGSALMLVTWRQKKILRRLRLAPVPVVSVVTARVGVNVAIALVQTALFIGVALLPYFGLRLTDSWWMAIPLVTCGTLAFLALGLLVGAWAKSQEAASAAANLIVLPMAFLGGAFFPLDLAPTWMQQLSLVFPLRHLVEGLQAVMVRGEGPAAALPAMGILVGFAVVVSAVAVWLFRWDDV